MGKEKTTSLTISQWHEYAKGGTKLPMRIPINGISMFPLIRRNRDMVTIVPVDKVPDVGDIVLFSDPKARERYVLHRLWSMKGSLALTWGDNCVRPDAWISTECIWGKAVLIERGNRQVHPIPRRGMIMARIWHPIVRIRYFCYRILSKVWHWVKSVMKR